MTNADLTLFLLQVGVILGVTVVLGRIGRALEYNLVDGRVCVALITMAVTTSMLGASVLRRILGAEHRALEEGTVTAQRVGQSLARAGA